MSDTSTEIHREFEMERLILFSDAVFAIAITLLILEIKFPETPENPATANYLRLFRPTIIHGAAFILSFIFIGNFWAKHLKLCRHMKSYDNLVIRLNLLYLFFIVTFPFTANGIAEHTTREYVLPMILYIVNIACCNLAHTALCYYVFYKNPALSIPGSENQKKYIYLQSKYFSLALILVVAVSIINSIVYPNNFLYFSVSIYILPFVKILTNKRLKKLKNW